MEEFAHNSHTVRMRLLVWAFYRIGEVEFPKLQPPWVPSPTALQLERASILRALKNGLDLDLDGILLAKTSHLSLIGADLDGTGMTSLHAMIRDALIMGGSKTLPAVFEGWHGRQRVLRAQIRSLETTRPRTLMQTARLVGLKLVLREGTMLLIDALRSGCKATVSPDMSARELVEAYNECLHQHQNSDEAPISPSGTDRETKEQSTKAGARLVNRGVLVNQAMVDKLKAAMKAQGHDEKRAAKAIGIGLKTLLNKLRQPGQRTDVWEKAEAYIRKSPDASTT